MNARTLPCALVIEDEVPMRRFLRVLLEGADFQVLESGLGHDGIQQAATHNPDVVLLDLGLPDMDGVEVTQRIRAWSQVPIIIVSARGLEHDKVRALDEGADDYLTKPFGSQELMARLRAAMRRSAQLSAAPESVWSCGRLRVDLAKRQVFVDSEEVRLTPTEYRLLQTLVQHAGRVMTHRQLLRHVWGPGASNRAHYVRVYMAHLRRKLEQNPAQPTYLLTEAGVGYRLTTGAASTHHNAT